MSKFVMSNCNVIIPSPDRSDSIRLFRGQVGEAPDWVAKTAYFKAGPRRRAKRLPGKKSRRSRRPSKEDAGCFTMESRSFLA